MKTMIIEVVYILGQCPTTGSIEPNHNAHRIENILWLSHKFNFIENSELKTIINDIREEIISPIVNQINEKLPKGSEVYKISKPKMTGNLSLFRRKIVIPVQIQVEIDENDSVEPEGNGFINALINAKVMTYSILGERLCMYPHSAMATWPMVKFGNKEEYYENLKARKKKEREIFNRIREKTIERKEACN